MAAKIIDIKGVLGRPRNRISKIGVELEGGWLKGPVGYPIERDGSVFKDAGDGGGLIRANHPGVKFGEIPLRPMQVGQALPILKKYYPTMIDESCGMHVHMGLETVFQYGLLCDSPDYQETVLAYLLLWAKEEGFNEKHHIWPRLTGKSIYCQKKFWPNAQMETNRKDHDHEREGHRYTAIHYCWGRYKTVECRVLPMFDSPEIGARAIRRLVDITNAYLMVTNKTRVQEGGKIKFEDGEATYEEHVIKI